MALNFDLIGWSNGTEPGLSRKLEDESEFLEFCLSRRGPAGWGSPHNLFGKSDRIVKHDRSNPLTHDRLLVVDHMEERGKREMFGNHRFGKSLEVRARGKRNLRAAIIR